MKYTITVIADEKCANGVIFYKQRFSKLDIARLVKELNTAYWASPEGAKEEE